MLARIILRVGCIVPLHSHYNEPVTYVLEGALKSLIQDRKIIVRAREVLVIPSKVPHAAEVLEDPMDLDIFCPLRDD
jgi:quercetin dioxygenase-like cupin family protein